MHRSVSRRLTVAVAVLLALLAAHDLTHALDDGLETSLSGLALVAIPQWLVLGAVLVIVVRAERARGALLALVLGVGVTVGFVAVHILPFAPAPFQDLEPSSLSWLFLVLPAAGGMIVSALAWSEWRVVTRPAPPRGPMPTPTGS